MKKMLLALSCLFCLHLPAGAWGPKGHDVAAYVAECHLTPEAARRIDELLDGYSIVYWCNWMDTASHTPEYAFSRTWHYLNIDEGHTLDTTTSRNPHGDVLTAIDLIMRTLREHSCEPDREAMYLKMLVHLLGDLHCPMHSGRRSDLGGNRVPVLYFGRPTDLHSVWDSALVGTVHKWSYTEWQQQLDRLSPEEIARIQAGEPEDWFRQTHEIGVEIYESTPEGTDCSYDYVAKYTPVIERQLMRAGYRLARLLNELFDDAQQAAPQER